MDAHKLIEWAEDETTEIADLDDFEGDTDVTERLSGQLFKSDHNHDFWRAVAALAQLQLQRSRGL